MKGRQLTAGSLRRRQQNELVAAVLAPGGFVVALDGRAVEAVADGVHAGWVNAQSVEFLANDLCTAVTERAVVLGSAAFVAISFHPYGGRGVVFEVVGHSRDFGLLFRP